MNCAGRSRVDKITMMALITSCSISVNHGAWRAWKVRVHAESWRRISGRCRLCFAARMGFARAVHREFPIARTSTRLCKPPPCKADIRSAARRADISPGQSWRHHSRSYRELSGERKPVPAATLPAPSLLSVNRSRSDSAWPSQKATLLRFWWRKPCVPAQRPLKD